MSPTSPTPPSRTRSSRPSSAGWPVAPKQNPRARDPHRHDDLLVSALGGQALVAVGRDLWRALIRIERLLAWPLILLVRGYKLFVSPALPPSCKYHPSCSAYADEALCRHGLLRGSLLMTWRLCRCNPLSRGGYDPVPGSDPTIRPTGAVKLRLSRQRPTRGEPESPALQPLEETS